MYFIDFLFIGSQLLYSGIILVQGHPEDRRNISEHLILLGQRIDPFVDHPAVGVLQGFMNSPDRMPVLELKLEDPGEQERQEANEEVSLHAVIPPDIHRSSFHIGFYDLEAFLDFPEPAVLLDDFGFCQVDFAADQHVVAVQFQVPGILFPVKLEMGLDLFNLPGFLPKVYEGGRAKSGWIGRRRFVDTEGWLVIKEIGIGI